MGRRDKRACARYREVSKSMDWGARAGPHRSQDVIEQTRGGCCSREATIWHLLYTCRSHHPPASSKVKETTVLRIGGSEAGAWQSGWPPSLSAPHAQPQSTPGLGCSHAHWLCTGIEFCMYADPEMNANIIATPCTWVLPRL